MLSNFEYASLKHLSRDRVCIYLGDLFTFVLILNGSSIWAPVDCAHLVF